MMVRFETAFGPVWVRSSEIIAILPEKNRAEHSVIYTYIFPDGLAVNEAPTRVVELIASAEHAASDEEE